jgi:hypothetical protein
MDVSFTKRAAIGEPTSGSEVAPVLLKRPDD